MPWQGAPDRTPPFLVIILVLCLINLLPLDGRAKHIARVIVIVIGIISMLKYLAVF